jgi:hypothetical protein
MAALGVALLAFGILSTVALVDLVRDSTLTGSIDVSLLGVSFGTRSAEEIMMAAVGLAVVATAFLLGGSVALLAGRRRRRSKQMEEKRVLVSRLETTERLLEHRVELLLAQVRELEERKDRIGGEPLKTERTAPARVDDVFVLPDVRPPAPEPADRSRPDESGRRR